MIANIYKCEYCGKTEEVPVDRQHGGKPSGWWDIYNGRGLSVGPANDSHVCGTSCAFAWAIKNGPISSGTMCASHPQYRYENRLKVVEEREQNIEKEKRESYNDAFRSVLSMIDSFKREIAEQTNKGVSFKTLMRLRTRVKELIEQRSR